MGKTNKRDSKVSTVKPSLLIDALQIVALFSLAVAYPVYLFLRTNPAYILTNGLTPGQIYTFIGLLSVGFPCLLVLIVIGFRPISKTGYRRIHVGSLTILTTVLFLPLISRIDALPYPVVLLLAVLGAAIIVHQSITSRFTHIGIACVATATVILPFQFTNDHHIKQILKPAKAEQQSWEVTHPDDLPPIVMIVFDAFPLVHLLDANGAIDKSRFPNFGLLANQATWYSNATTVHDITLKSIPAILTGRYPMPGEVLPVPENYPHSLFDLLRPHYTIHAYESATGLSGMDGDVTSGVETSLAALTTDLTIFYARSLLPESVADRWLPLEEGVWGGFLEHLPQLRHETRDTRREWQEVKNESLDIKHRFFAVRQYIEEIKNHPARTFHFLHTILPHGPYQFLPTGRVYGFSPGRNVPEVEVQRRKLRAHVLQVGLADSIIGMVRTELIREGLYDDCLMVVVADHGVALREGINERLIGQDNVGEVGFVPLFIKYPGQQEGRIDSSNVQTIDIVPTINAELGFANTPDTDGRSLLDADAVIPVSKTIVSDSGSVVTFSVDTYQRGRDLAHQEMVEFFALNDERSRVYNYGDGLDYIGLETSAVEARAIPCHIVSEAPARLAKLTFNTHRLPLLVDGAISFDGPIPKDVVIAFSVNGVIRAVSSPYSAYGKMHIHKILSDTYFQEGSNELKILVLPVDPS